jgi:membrane fusion protein (multidrug efflux system)
MKKQMIVMLVAVGVFVLALAGIKFWQIQKAIAAGSAFQPPPEAVTTLVAKEERWPVTLRSIGTVAAVKGVVVSADLPGLVDEIAFDSGRTVAEGDVLLRLDTRQEQAQLKAAEAQLELARMNFERMSGLLGRGVTSKAEHDRTAAEHKQAEARVGEVRATIERKTVRAPFAGVLGIRQVNRGQYLNPGDPIVPVQSLDPIYVNFSVPQQDLAPLKPGAAVYVTAEGLNIEIIGKVTAVDSVVDEATRNVRVQASLRNTDRILRPGMFVNAEVRVGDGDALPTVPATAVLNAPYGDSVFVIEEMKDPKDPKKKAYKGARQQFVKVGQGRGDQVAIVSGLKAGDEVATSGVFKLRNGVAVYVDNTAQPGNDPAPKPEDN